MREEGKEKARQGTSNVVIDRGCCIGGSDYRDLCVGGCDKIVVLVFRPWCRKRGRAVEEGGQSEKQPYEGTAFGENRAPSPPPKMSLSHPLGCVTTHGGPSCPLCERHKIQSLATAL